MSLARSSTGMDEMGARRVLAMGIGLLVVGVFGIQLVRSAFLVLLLPVLAFAFLFLTAPRYAVYFLMAFFTLVGVIPWLFPTIGFLTSGFFSVTTGLSLLTGFLGIIYFMLTKGNPFRFRITAPFLCFLVICVLSGYLALDRVLALRRIVKFVCSFVFALVIAESFTKREHLMQLWKVTLITSAIPLGVSFFQLATGRVPYYMGLEMSRLWGTFSNPNEFGFYLVVLTTVSLALIFVAPGRRVRLIRFAFFVALGACFVLTRSRGAWIGFAVMIVVFCVSMRRKRILLLLAPLMVAVVFLSPATMSRIKDEAAAGSLEWRLKQWQTVLPFVRENPLLGIGLESSYAHWIFGEATQESLMGQYGFARASVHNTYLQFLVEIGAIGLLMFLWLMFVATQTAYVGLKRHAGDPVLQMTSALSLSFMLAFGIMSLNWSFFGAPAREIWFWFMAGVAEAVYRMPRAETPAVEPAPVPPEAEPAPAPA